MDNSIKKEKFKKENCRQKFKYMKQNPICTKSRETDVNYERVQKEKNDRYYNKG